MSSQDLLTTLAEVAIALAGFSGIVAVLGGRAGGAWSDIDRFRLSLLLNTSFGAVLWSFVPLVLLSARVAPATVWLVTSGGYCVYLGIVALYRSRQLRVLVRSHEFAPVLPYTALIGTGSAAALALQLLNAWSLRTFWPHVGALLWALTVGFMQFVRLLRSSWS